MSIIMKIKEAFEKTGKSIREVARKTGIDRAYLSELAKNEIPADEITLAEMVVLAEELDLAITEMYEVRKFKLI